MTEINNENPPAAAKPTRTSRAKRRKIEIVSAAASVFDDLGYHRTTMDELATRVGSSKGTLYHYFSSKEEILYLIHDQYVEQLLQRWNVIAATASRDPVEQLSALVTDLLLVMRDHQSHVRVFLENYREVPEPFRSRLAHKRDAYFHILKGILDAGVDTGDFRPSDTTLLTAAILSMCNLQNQGVAKLVGQESAVRHIDYDPTLLTYRITRFIVDGISAR